LRSFDLRMELDSSHYMLDPKIFWDIVNKFGFPNLDLFARNVTAQCKRFVSWFPTPNCVPVDAFSFVWRDNFYAFPPFALISRVLKKIKLDKFQGIVVVPKWPGQPWFPDFLSMIVSSVQEYGPSYDLLSFSYSSRLHPMNNTLVLMAATLSGNLWIKWNWQPL